MAKLVVNFERVKNWSFSGVALIACCLMLFAASNLYYPKWSKSDTEATISWDVSGYYSYLPAYFIYGDPGNLEFMEEVIKTYRPSPQMDQAFMHESGNYVFKYPAGMSVVYAPAFFAAHVYAHFSSHPTDGFSRPYQFAISQWSLFVAFAGLFFLRRFLLHYFGEVAVGVTLLCIVFGSNYLSYASTNGAMTHNYLFTIYAALLLVTRSFYNKPGPGKGFLIGLLCGTAALIRPTEAIVALIPLIWGLGFPIRGFALRRIRFYLEHSWSIGLAVLGFILMGSIQLIYWKSISGDWLVYSYEDQGFSWHKPRIWRGFFSARAGWLTYSPVMAFALIGFFFLRKQHRSFLCWTSLYVALVIYITLSWDIWWYGGSLGQRALVQSYAVMAIPFAALVTSMWRKNLRKWLFVVFAVLFTLHGLYWFHQSHKGGLFMAEQMNRAYYWEVLWRFDVDEDARKLLDTNERISSPFKNERLVFSKEISGESISDCSHFAEGERGFCLVGGYSITPFWGSNATPEPHENYARAYTTIGIGQKEWDRWKQTIFYIQFFRGEELVKYQHIRIQRFLSDNQKREMYLDTALPESEFDRVGVVVDNPGSPHPVWVDNLRIYFY